MWLTLNDGDKYTALQLRKNKEITRAGLPFPQGYGHLIAHGLNKGAKFLGTKDQGSLGFLQAPISQGEPGRMPTTPGSCGAECSQYILCS